MFFLDRSDGIAADGLPDRRARGVVSRSWGHLHTSTATRSRSRQTTCAVISASANIYPSGAPYAWEFSRAGRTIEFQPRGPLSLDDRELMVEAALSDIGLAFVWEERVRPYVADGRLVECLASWATPMKWLSCTIPHASSCPQACAPSSRCLGFKWFVFGSR